MCAQARIARTFGSSAGSGYEHAEKASLTQFLLGNNQFAWLLPGKPKCHLPRQNLLAMRAMVKVTTRTVVALSIQWWIRMATEVAFVQRSVIATTRRSFTVVITTRMTETVNRLVIVTRMAHGHHWVIRSRQLDVCSRANKHAAR